MEKEYAKHETDYIEEYRKKGFGESFRIDDGKLKSSESGKSYMAGDLVIRAENRFEGMSDPSDLSILYAIEAMDGSKGTLLMAYGPNADLSAHEFIEDIAESKDMDKADGAPFSDDGD